MVLLVWMSHMPDCIAGLGRASSALYLAQQQYEFSSAMHPGICCTIHYGRLSLHVNPCTHSCGVGTLKGAWEVLEDTAQVARQHTHSCTVDQTVKQAGSAGASSTISRLGQQAGVHALS